MTIHQQLVRRGQHPWITTVLFIGIWWFSNTGKALPHICRSSQHKFETQQNKACVPTMGICWYLTCSAYNPLPLSLINGLWHPKGRRFSDGQRFCRHQSNGCGDISVPTTLSLLDHLHSSDWLPVDTPLMLWSTITGGLKNLTSFGSNASILVYKFQCCIVWYISLFGLDFVDHPSERNWIFTNWCMLSHNYSLI